MVCINKDERDIMPELPEVETVMRGLSPVLTGRTFATAEARRPDLRLPIPADFTERLVGNCVERLTRRSKYILIEMADGLVVILHLGMSGRVTITARGDALPVPGKHDHIVLTTDRGDHVYYNDTRRFGIVTFTDVQTMAAHPLLRGIGPEPLGNAFNTDVLNAGLKGRKSSIKAALLDQKLVAGLGNIYVCEALWRAGISPKRQAHTVAGKRAERLVPIIRQVLTEAIEAGGSTLRDYARTDGELGYFQHSFKAYGRAGEACAKPDCDGSIVRIVQSNRSTFHCTRCQR
jgi:formamidopyrimidine-DNA glycosylase